MRLLISLFVISAFVFSPLIAQCGPDCAKECCKAQSSATCPAPDCKDGCTVKCKAIKRLIDNTVKEACPKCAEGKCEAGCAKACTDAVVACLKSGCKDCSKGCASKACKKECAVACKVVCAKVQQAMVALEAGCIEQCQKACAATCTSKECKDGCTDACKAYSAIVCNGTCRKVAGNEEEMMKKWMEYATPGKHHENLQPMVGSWKAVSKMWMPGQSEPTITEGTSETSWVLGGRYLVQHYHSTFNGMPFEGYGMTAYDNYKKQYLGSWIDSFGTGVYYSTGSCSKDGKVLTMHGKMTDPAMGECETKDVVRIINHTKHIFEMYRIVGGKEFKIMEITYTRK